jgi:electron transport complex protein RnfC
MNQNFPSRWGIVGALSEATGGAIAPERPVGLLSLRDALRRDGIRIDRMGCASLDRQLELSVARPVDTVLCSLLDADPATGVNAAIWQDFAAMVVEGIQWLAQASGAGRKILVSDRTGGDLAGVKPNAITKQVRVAHAYPQLHPSLLLRLALNRRVSPGRSPVEAGVIAIDASTAWCVARYAGGEPPLLPVAFHDVRSRHTRFLLCSPSVLWIDVAYGAEPKVLTAQPLRVVVGPPLVARSLTKTATVGSIGVLEAYVREVSRVAMAPSSCIRCAWCHDVCPVGVEPALVLESVQRGAPELAEAARAGNCVECGLCQFVCPSYLPLSRALAEANGREEPVTR